MNTPEITDNATSILKIWTLEPVIKLKDLTLEQFQQDNTTLTQVLAQVEQKEEELTALRNQRDDLAEKLSANNTRVRAGIKSFYGSNSTEYELAGGTRAADRKPSTRKSKQPEVIAAK